MPGREAPRRAADLHFVHGHRLRAVRVEPEEQQPHRRGERRDARHVGHRLVGEEPPIGHRREDERAEERGAAPVRLRHAFVEQVHRHDRHQDDGRSHDPLGVHRRQRAVADEHLVGHVVEPERRHRDRLDPEIQDRLREEPAVLRPPERDPVVARQDLARHLAVVRLPRIPERVRPHHREVEDGGRDQHPEAVAVQERPRCARLVFGPRAELHPCAERLGHEPDEGRRDEEAPGPLRDHEPSTRERDRQAEREERRRDAEDHRPERRERMRRGDAIVGVVERAEEIHQPPHAHDAEHDAEGDARAPRDRSDEERVAVDGHEHERTDGADRRGDAAPHPAKRVARRQQHLRLGRLDAVRDRRRAGGDACLLEGASRPRLHQADDERGEKEEADRAPQDRAENAAGRADQRQHQAHRDQADGREDQSPASGAEERCAFFVGGGDSYGRRRRDRSGGRFVVRLRVAHALRKDGAACADISVKKARNRSYLG